MTKKGQTAKPTDVFGIRLTPAERQRLDAAAVQLGLNTSTFVRMAALKEAAAMGFGAGESRSAE